MVSSSGGRGAGEIGGLGGWVGGIGEKTREIMANCQWEMDVWKKKRGKKVFGHVCTTQTGTSAFFSPFIYISSMRYIGGHMICLLLFFFKQILMPKIAAFVVVGLIPLSAPASRTHCVSFCSPQEGRTGASVFGLAMSKSALLVLSRGGCTPSLPLSLSQPHH